MSDIDDESEPAGQSSFVPAERDDIFTLYHSCIPDLLHSLFCLRNPINLLIYLQTTPSIVLIFTTAGQGPPTHRHSQKLAHAIFPPSGP